MRISLSTLSILLLTACFSCLPLHAQDDASAPLDLTNWLNSSIQTVLHKPIDLRDSGRQTEIPALGDSSSALVDRSSAPALVGTALNLAGIPTGSDQGNDSGITTTLSLYSLYAGIFSTDTLDPAFYARHAKLRRVSLTAGYEENQGENGDQRAQIFGLKWLIVDKRRPEANRANLQKVQDALTDATGAFGNLEPEVRSFILRHPNVQARLAQGLLDKGKTPDEAKQLSEGKLEDLVRSEGEFFVSFQNQIFEQNFETTLQDIGEEGQAVIFRMIESQIDPFANLDQQSKNAIAEIQRKPQFSFSSLARHLPEGKDKYSGELIYDQGIGKRAALTLNGSYGYVEGNDSERSTHSARAATQIEVSLGQKDHLAGPNPSRLSIGIENLWKTAEKDAFRAQVKLSLPVMDGVEFPISVTFSNREELIDEEDVRGNFGFTLDMARLVDGLRARLTNGIGGGD